MSKITDYTVVSTNESVDDLIRYVNQHIGAGWQPYGNLFETGDGVIVQAVVKYATPEDEIDELIKKFGGMPVTAKDLEIEALHIRPGRRGDGRGQVIPPAPKPGVGAIEDDIDQIDKRSRRR